MIWVSLLIPVIAVLIAAFVFHEKMHIIEYVALFLIPLICILIGKYASISAQTKDREYWNSYAETVFYEEEWNERVPCRHPKYETRTRTYTDSNGRTRTETYEVQVGYKHLYDVDSHPEKWYLIDNINRSRSINKQNFEDVCKLWNMREFKDLNRDFHSKDGDMYFSSYDNIFDHTIPLCTIHTYKNKIQNSSSVFNFKAVSEDTINQYGLFNYPPENTFDFNPIMGWNDYNASKALSIYNALNGQRKQLHMKLLVFKDKPIEAGEFQKCYWKGGNKNEFIVCVGIIGSIIDWVKVISWTDQEVLKAKTEREIKEMIDFDVTKIVKYMGENVPDHFIRKEFADFSYISVEPTMRAVIITFIVTLITTILIFSFFAYNDMNWRG